ncbi:MAG: glycoside hydrolase family 25 protein, partial [Polyangia bacterium]
VPALLLATLFLCAQASAAATATAAAAVAAPADDCGEPRRLSGIDVSSYQGAIDWTRVHAAGIVFAFARISDGLDVVDERFAGNLAGMRHAGVRRGAYQYFRAGADPIAQADLAIRAVRRAGGVDLPLVADVETDDGQTPEVVQERLIAWIARVDRRTGRRPIVYTSPSAGTRLLGGRFGDLLLWIAHYETDCPALPDGGWERWTFWQHSQTGRIDGIAGNVDLDDFAGTRGALRRLRRRR